VSEAPLSISAPADRAETTAVGPLLARAFLDDPVWARIGPRGRGYRRHTSRVAFWGIVRASARHGARLRIARAVPAERLLGASIAVAEHVAHPHLYLWYIGVDPTLHRSGVGRALMADLHGRADELGLPTYLETGTPGNVRFYEGLGYEHVGRIAVPGGPRLWKMERPPAAAAQ
jgi:GNAT superfamily N-acetyltransferase